MRLPVSPMQKPQLLCGLFALEDMQKTRHQFVPSSRYAPIGATSATLTQKPREIGVFDYYLRTTP
jgi:hypothetical protein